MLPVIVAKQRQFLQALFEQRLSVQLHDLELLFVALFIWDSFKGVIKRSECSLQCVF
jgi:hypothetical protein